MLSTALFMYAIIFFCRREKNVIMNDSSIFWLSQSTLFRRVNKHLKNNKLSRSNQRTLFMSAKKFGQNVAFYWGNQTIMFFACKKINGNQFNLNQTL